VKRIDSAIQVTATLEIEVKAFHTRLLDKGIKAHKEEHHILLVLILPATTEKELPKGIGAISKTIKARWGKEDLEMDIESIDSSLTHDKGQISHFQPLEFGRI
jgi:hypothetical protein